MRKLALLSALACAAILAAPASSDVARYQFGTAAFTVTQPAGSVGQWASVWTHRVAVTVDPCARTFTGTAVQLDPSMQQAYTETVTGSYADGTISVRFVRNDGVVWWLTDARFAPAVSIAQSTPAVPWVLEAKVAPWVFTPTSDYRNHGQYVKEMGSDVAHSCIGMPITG